MTADNLRHQALIELFRETLERLTRIETLLLQPTARTPAADLPHRCDPCNESFATHKHLLTHRAEDHAGGTDPYNITQEATT